MIDSRSYGQQWLSTGRAAGASRVVMAALLCAGLALAPSHALAKKKPPKGAWDVVRTNDPITGRSTCVVSSLDRIGRSRYTRFGYLYAVVENNPEAGLLVGVSSGGRLRLPVGDVVWRVDDKPYRTLKAADNPLPARIGQGSLASALMTNALAIASDAAAAGASPSAPATHGDKSAAAGAGPGPSATKAGDTTVAATAPIAASPSSATPAPAAEAAVNDYVRTMQAAMARQAAMVSEITASALERNSRTVATLGATATMASGETARAMLEEMKAGKSLLYRQDSEFPAYGLPSHKPSRIGVMTNKGWRPIPIDQSFHDGLVACGITTP